MDMQYTDVMPEDAVAETPPVAAETGGSPVSVQAKPEKPRKSNLRRGENLIGWLYISPMIVGILVFTAIPLVMSIMAMFYQWNGIVGLFESEFVGWRHFQDIFGGLNSELYWNSLVHTLIYAIQLPVCLILGIFLALAMNRDMKGVQVFRVIYYIPGVMSVVAVSIVWQNMFASDGYINAFLKVLGMNPVGWLTTKGGVAFTVNLLLVWKGVGYSTLMLIAGLQSVSTEQIEAAKIDGANSWTILWKITVPALYPIIFYLFVTGLMGALQMFNEPYILLSGQKVPDDFDLTTVGFVYKFFNPPARNLGLASVGAWILAFFIFIVTAIQMYVDKRREED